MAERRMFAKSIIDSDLFLDMPQSSQNLYFHLSLRADDDGFVGNPKKIIRMIGCSEDDMKILIAKQFLIPFESGVVVIKHWKIHNYIRNDRYKPTIYTNEKKALTEKENKEYCFGIPTVNQMDTQYSIGKISLDKNSIDEDKKEEKDIKPIRHKHGEYGHVLLTDDQLNKLKEKFVDYQEKIQNLDDYIEMKGAKYKNHYLTIIKWAKKDEPKQEDYQTQVKRTDKKPLPKQKVISKQEINNFNETMERLLRGE